ncbi:MAG: ankyrin repeat domain-containing protein [Victivallales bacterium]|nr:ankyrin repeat domain-containing protein [Victivallales bacterium]
MNQLKDSFLVTLCLFLLFFVMGLNAQTWRRYSPLEAENLQKFRQCLEKDKELKDAYERYQNAVKKQKDLLAEDAVYQGLLRQRKDAEETLRKLQADDRGGNEVSHQYKLLGTLKRKIRECINENMDFKTLEKEITEARQDLRVQLAKNEISLYYFSPTFEEICGDVDVDFMEEMQDDYELGEGNPFKDAFADLSKALFEKDFAKEASTEITRALVKEFPKSSPESIGKCVGFFYDPDGFIALDEKNIDKEREDVFDECVRILSWMRMLKHDDKAGWEAVQSARKAVYHRIEGGSIFRFIWAYQWSRQNRPQEWLDDFAQWISDHPEQSGLMKYVHELLEYRHIGKEKNDKTQMQLLEEHLNLMTEKLKDPWILHVARSINAWSRAWNARGGGYANTVSEKGWKIWGIEKKKAIQEAQIAIRLHPDWSAGYIGILEDFQGNHIEDFLQLMRYRPDFTEAYTKLIWGLLPRWGGSHAEIVALARTCMETKRYDTALPSIGFNLLGLVAWDTVPWAQWSRVYRQKWLEPLAVELFDARIKQNQWLRRDSRLDKALYFIAIGKYGEAAMLVKAIEADNDGKEVVFPSWNGRYIGNWYAKVPAWEDALTHLRLMTGEYATQLIEIENLSMDNRRCLEAIARLAEFIKTHQALNEKEKEFLIDLRARWQMPDVSPISYWGDKVVGGAFKPAFNNGYTKVIREMMEAGIDYRKFESFPGEMALLVAMRGSDPTMLDLLKEMGDPLDSPEKDPKFQGDQPIHMAVMTSNIPMLKKLLELGISPESRNSHNHTPMHFCAQHGSVEGISILLAAGASPDVQDGDGDTPLMFVPQTQVSPQCLRLLAQASKNVNIGNGAGMTALHYAAKCGNSPEYIKILLAAGADPQARTPGGKTPYDLAMSRHRDDLAALLPKPDPKGGKVYQTNAPAPARKVSHAAATRNDDWLSMVATFISMPEVYGIMVCIGLGGIVWFVVRKRKRVSRG